MLCTRERVIALCRFALGVALSVVAGYAWCATDSSAPSDVTSVALIVKLSRSMSVAPAPATVLSTVAAATSGAATDFSLYARFSSPAAADWLIKHRLPQDYLDQLALQDPDHPELHLQEYILLSYSSVAARMSAESKLQSDVGVISAIPTRR